MNTKNYKGFKDLYPDKAHLNKNYSEFYTREYF